MDNVRIRLEVILEVKIEEGVDAEEFAEGLTFQNADNEFYDDHMYSIVGSEVEDFEVDKQ